MASRFQSDLRRQVGSPRPKGRENKDTLCRNVLIYGHCRYEDQGCTFSHDLNRNNTSQDMSKKPLNVELPSFTPASIQPRKALPTQAASAPAFTPRALGAPPGDEAAVFNPAAIREFTPGFDAAAGANGSAQETYDPFSMAAVGQSLPAAQLPAAQLPAAQFNPYDDHGSSFFPPQGAFTTPLQTPLQHLYFPTRPRPDDLLPYQRMTHEFFMPEKLRQELQNRIDATRLVIPNSQLPQLDNFHSLVTLDTTHRKNANVFGYPTWVYKAFSSKNGYAYCLRRLEGFRLTNEHAIRSVKEWRRVDCANVVRVYDAFTPRAFGDSSLVFVLDYHALSKTLAEAHLSGGRPQAKVAEAELWSYVSQIANALRAIHAANLAARCVDAGKIILTDKDRVRLNACAVLDVVHFELQRPLHELQQEDLQQFGRTMLCLATGTLPVHLTNLNAAVEQMSRSYSAELRDTVVWLLTPQQGPQKTIDEFMRGIAGRIAATLDHKGHELDELARVTTRELENGRVARLLLKLGAVNERYDFNGDPAWSENGERYMLKLFRDYVFHQVDAGGSPVLDVGHMLECLGRLDAGTEERICLTSRDEQTSFLVSYRELKKMLANAFGELQKSSKQGKGF